MADDRAAVWDELLALQPQLEPSTWDVILTLANAQNGLDHDMVERLTADLAAAIVAKGNRTRIARAFDLAVQVAGFAPGAGLQDLEAAIATAANGTAPRPKSEARKATQSWADVAEQALAATFEAPEHKSQPSANRILTGETFVSGYVPPVWLIDGIAQRSRLYACTSLTGHGKTAVWLYNALMIQVGRPIGALRTYHGNVLYLAGENPADLQARMVGMLKACRLGPQALPFVLPQSFPLTPEEADMLHDEIAVLGIPLALIIGDTAASFFPGEDENDNVASGGYARTLRSFTECPGNPAVVVLSHPTKNASKLNLLPRGGGAFLNELDGNLTLWSEIQGEVTTLGWHGKIRGPDFAPLGYRLRAVPTGLEDEHGRPDMTIIAEPISDEAVAENTKENIKSQDLVLKILHDHPGWSFTEIASCAGWYKDDRPMKTKVQRAVNSLHADKLIEQARKGAKWTLTKKGKTVMKDGGL